MDWNDKKQVAEYNKQYRLNRIANTDKKVIAEEDKKKFEKYYVSTKGRASHMLNNARARAKSKGLQCTLTQDWIIDKLNNGLCEVTNLPLAININGGKGHKDNPFSPSIDRIKQDGDYTPENCRITCWIYNRARGAFPDNSFDIMIESLMNRK